MFFLGDCVKCWSWISGELELSRKEFDEYVPQTKITINSHIVDVGLFLPELVNLPILQGNQISSTSLPITESKCFSNNFTYKISV